MAVYEASKVRAVAIELTEKTAQIYTDLLPIFVETNSWTLNGLDPALPSPFTVRVQIEAYEAAAKETLRLTSWIAEIKEALIDDTLTYPNPPLFFDGGTIFDGGGDPEGVPAP